MKKYTKIDPLWMITKTYAKILDDFITGDGHIYGLGAFISKNTWDEFRYIKKINPFLDKFYIINNIEKGIINENNV